MKSGFVHLHLHSEYSLVDGIVRIKPLMKKSAELNMPAIAITDQSNLFAMVKFYRAAIASGIKPIIGVDFHVYNEADRNQPSRLVLLCQSHAGYLNLTRLVSRTYLEGQHLGIPMLEKSWLKGATDGLIALSGGRTGDIGMALLSGNTDQANNFARQWQELFPERFYLELQRTGRVNEETYIHAAVDLALSCNLPVVATNDVQFISRDDFESHEARVCIHEGRTLDDPRRPKNFTEQQYLRSPQEMIALFEDIPEAIENTIEIAKRCSIELTLGENYLPDFPVPEGMTIEEFLAHESREGLEKRLDFLFDTTVSSFKEQRVEYDDRLKLELDVINEMGFPGYFLIVADFIRWAKENGVPVGPGRGSGAGSLVAYALGITDLDPIKYELLFERFLNPERVSMPDFDVDFCMEGRDRVIEYVAQRYGRERVSQIITYGTMAAKAVVRDVGRVLGYPYGFCDGIAKLIPFEIGMTLDKALEQEEVLATRYADEDEVQTLIDLARSLEGITRNAGKHAGGVVISPSELTDFTPLYCEHGSSATVTQFDKDDVESVGLVKFDFLGLRTLTIIDWTIQIINRHNSQEGKDLLDINTIPIDDEKTFELLKNCATTAVFQLESRGMKDLIKRLQPDSFDEIVALVALFRPGPLQSGMVDDFIDRKHGRKKVEYPHPDIEPILKPTYGVILYQEQVMQIAQVLAGYTLGGADLLRRAMGKKKPEEMAKQRDIFTSGAVERGVKEKTATMIFDLMEKFAGYGFNKSHSAAYALVSYQTAWLKAHYPSEFMSAVLSSDMDNTDKVVSLIDECGHMKLEVVPPHINSCFYRFSVRDKQSIFYGLGAVKGVGEAAIENIVQERMENGAYTDLFDFCQRIDLRKANRRTLEALIRAGALDNPHVNRASMMSSVSAAVQLADKQSRDQDSGQNDLFGVGAGTQTEKTDNTEHYVMMPDWSEEERLAGEKETLGLYLTGHPITRYEKELAKFTSARIVDLRPAGDSTLIVSGLIIAIRTMRTRRGDRMAFITLDDRSGRIELAVFSDVYENCRDLIAKDKLIVVRGEVSVDEYTDGYKMSAKDIYSFDQAMALYCKKLEISVDTRIVNGEFVKNLQSVLQPFSQGECPVIIRYKNDSAAAPVVLGKQWCVSPTQQLLSRLGEMVENNNVNMVYKNSDVIAIT